MAESIAADLASGLIGKLVSLAANEVILIWNLEKDLEKLGARFSLIDSLMKDAYDKNITMYSVKYWFDQLEDVVNDTEAFIDELAYEVTRRKVENRFKLARDYFIPSKNPLIYRREVAGKIKSINASFDEIFQWARELGLNAVAHLNSTVQPREIRNKPPYEDTKLIVGRDEDISYLVQAVCNKNEHDLHVVAIKGMGGQGKTTLASEVFNSADVTKMFTNRMWITVSEDFDYIKILNQMVESLTSTTSQLKNPQGIINKLQSNIKGERFLLVLDDVWNEASAKWGDLRNSLQAVSDAKGSSVIVTTRNQEVIDAMGHCVIYRVENLREHDSYELFKKIAFGYGGVSETQTFTDLGRSMVGKCGGLPLAIKALGGLLRSKESEKEWQEIQNSDFWKSKGVLYSLRSLRKVRLLCAGACVFREVLPYIPHLTVLVLNFDGFVNARELQKSLRNMIYIKHLDISCLYEKPPSYITELYNLQTLRVWDLEELPKKFCNLINLRHLYIEKSYGRRCMFNGIERLTCLQTLPHFVVSKEQNCLLEQLEGLHNLGGKVKLYGLNDVANMEEASKAKLCTKSNIESLLLNWRTDQDGSSEVESERERENESAIEGLEPHTNLKELIIEYFMGKRLGSWITKMTNLVNIRLTSCGRFEEFPSLGHLPKLREMELEGMDNVRIIGSNCGAAGKVTTMYPSLTKLRLENMQKLEEWVEGDTSRVGGDQSSVQLFPKLEVLKITFCSKLTRMPDSSFPSLKKLAIGDSKKILEEMSKKVSCLETKNGHMIEGEEGTSCLDISEHSLIFNSQSLSSLKLHECRGLTCLTVGVALEVLELDDCPDLTSINEAVKEGGCLRDLKITSCPSLSLVDQSAISTIKRLNIDEIRGALSSSVNSFPNLTHLSLRGRRNLVKSTLEFDDAHVSAFSALRTLNIIAFKGLKAVSDTIAKLSSLEVLNIGYCEELENLPTFDQSHTIRRLNIQGCPILSERCKKETGVEWYKIQHIPFIEAEK